MLLRTNRGATFYTVAYIHYGDAVFELDESEDFEAEKMLEKISFFFYFVLLTNHHVELTESQTNTEFFYMALPPRTALSTVAKQMVASVSRSREPTRSISLCIWAVCSA